MTYTREYNRSVAQRMDEIGKPLSSTLRYHSAMQTDQIHSNIAKVFELVRVAAEKHQRELDAIRVIAVSKTQPLEAVRAAAACGLRDFGENYLQEALEKIEATRDLDLCWHFIGPIQSNKTRAIAEHFDWVHSVDREKILRRLNEHRNAAKTPLNICLQVNISGESSKSGAQPEDLPALLDIAASCPNVRLRGLMAIPAPSESFAKQRQACEQLTTLFDESRQRHAELDTLSIGMSADMEAAIASGSTLLRIGTAIFGERRR